MWAAIFLTIKEIALAIHKYAAAANRSGDAVYGLADEAVLTTERWRAERAAEAAKLIDSDEQPKLT